MFVKFVSVWLMLFCADASSASPVTFALSTTVQVYVVPVGTMFPDPLLGATVNTAALHAVAVCEVTNGFGLTDTVTVNVDPVHEPDTGVTV